MESGDIVKRIHIRFYIALAIGVLASGFIYFFTNANIDRVKNSVEVLTSRRIKLTESALMFNIYFLRTRKAEKNLFITGDLKYEKELNAHLQETKDVLTSLEALAVDSSEGGLVAALRTNLDDYRESLDKLMGMVVSHEDNQGKFKKLSDRLAEINDMLAENVTYLVTKNRGAIETEQSQVRQSLSSLAIVPGVILIATIVAIGMATATLLIR